jgi:hypothetical protein
MAWLPGSSFPTPGPSCKFETDPQVLRAVRGFIGLN